MRNRIKSVCGFARCGEREHRFGFNFHFFVLHFSAIVVCVFFYGICVLFHYYFLVVFYVYFAAVSGAFVCITLMVESTVELCNENFAFVVGSSFAVANFSATACTKFVTRPKMRVFAYNFRDIFYCLTVSAGFFKQYGAVEECKQVIRFGFQNKIKVLYCEIILTYLGTKQSSVVMGKEILRINIDCAVVICHCIAQFLVVITDECAVDVIIGYIRRILNGMRQQRVGTFVVSFAECNHSACAPRIAVVVVLAYDIGKETVGF